MLYGSETWAATASTVKRLQRNDRAMVRWMCLVKPEDDTHFETLLSQLKIKDITDVLQLGRLRWLGHVERSTSWISQVRGLSIPTKRSQGRPKLSWDELVTRDRMALKMDSTNPQDRQAWRGRLRSRQTDRPNPHLED